MRFAQHLPPARESRLAQSQLRQLNCTGGEYRRLERTTCITQTLCVCVCVSSRVQSVNGFACSTPIEGRVCVRAACACDCFCAIEFDCASARERSIVRAASNLRRRSRQRRRDSIKRLPLSRNASATTRRAQINNVRRTGKRKAATISSPSSPPRRQSAREPTAQGRASSLCKRS